MFLILLQGTPVLPASAYILCFIPLATVIIGLVTLFALTDRHASRPYARYNLFVAAGAGPGDLAGRPPVVGETPAGPLGAAPAGTTTLFQGAHGALTTADKGQVPPSAAPDRPATFEGRAAPGMPEDLGLLSEAEQERLRASKQAPVAPQERASSAPMAQAIAITFIEYNPAGSDPQGEYVRIVNSAATSIDLTGWRLRDEGDKHRYTFPGFRLPPGAEVRLWSGRGTDDVANLYWSSRGAIWNNSGDTVILLDASGNEISRYSYGPQR